MDLPAIRLVDAFVMLVDRRIAARSPDCGNGTVTALNPGGIAGTVAVDTGSGTSIVMRRGTHYSAPAVSDKVKWSRSAAGDWYCDYKLA